MGDLYGAFYGEPTGGEGMRCKHPIRLDVYGCGCQHDCPYCYAKHLLEFRGLWDSEHPKAADRRYILKCLDKVPKGTVLRLGGMTDPFQPMERVWESSRWLLRKLSQRRIPYLIVTKGDFLTEYTDVLDEGLAHIQITVTSTEDSRNLEPNAPLPSKRLECAEALNDLGFHVQLRLSPFIEGMIDYSRIQESPVEGVVVEFLRLNGKMERLMPWVDSSKYTVKSGGYRHLPLAGKRVTVCEDVDDHYDYFTKNFNPNPDDCCDLRWRA